MAMKPVPPGQARQAKMARRTSKGGGAAPTKQRQAKAFAGPKGAAVATRTKSAPLQRASTTPAPAQVRGRTPAAPVQTPQMQTRAASGMAPRMTKAASISKPAGLPARPQQTSLGNPPATRPTGAQTLSRGPVARPVRPRPPSGFMK